MLWELLFYKQDFKKSLQVDIIQCQLPTFNKQKHNDLRFPLTLVSVSWFQLLEWMEVFNLFPLLSDNVRFCGNDWVTTFIIMNWWTNGSQMSSLIFCRWYWTQLFNICNMESS